MALVTIITVVFNGGQTLQATIDSVARITNHRIEYIVMDGGSTDNTLEIIQSNASTITHWISEPDNGIYDAMNKGWNLAKKDSYLLFLGSGDQLISLPDQLSEDYKTIYYGDVQIGNKLFTSKCDSLLKVGNTLHHQALLVPKALHPQPPFNLQFKTYADFDFNQRLLKMGATFLYNSQLKAYALPGGLSAQKVDSEMLAIVRKNFGFVTMIAAKIFYRLQRIKGSLVG